MVLSDKQAGVLNGMLVGAASALAIVILGAWLNPFSFQSDLGGRERLGIAIKASLLPAIFLAALVGGSRLLLSGVCVRPTDVFFSKPQQVIFDREMSRRPNESDTVAHYTRLEHLANILADGWLLLSPVGDLQDPREASMGWIENVGIGPEPHAPSIAKAHQIKGQASQQIRLLCTVGEREAVEGRHWVEESPYSRPRMWSQYGDSSRGFCLVLDNEILYELLRHVAERPEYAMSGKADYYPWLHLVASGVTIETGSDIDIEVDNSFPLLNENCMIRSVYFKKSFDWSAENPGGYP